LEKLVDVNRWREIFGIIGLALFSVCRELCTQELLITSRFLIICFFNEVGMGLAAHVSVNGL
jgi:hypothetical protein